MYLNAFQAKKKTPNKIQNEWRAEQKKNTHRTTTRYVKKKRMKKKKSTCNVIWFLILMWQPQSEMRSLFDLSVLVVFAFCMGKIFGPASIRIIFALCSSDLVDNFISCRRRNYCPSLIMTHSHTLRNVSNLKFSEQKRIGALIPFHFHYDMAVKCYTMQCIMRDSSRVTTTTNNNNKRN